MKLSSIHHYRTHQYRVFIAEPYFKLNLEDEITWHENHIRKLKLQARNPELFHRQRTSHKIEDHHRRHFQEQVIDSIPFHTKILQDHRQRLKTILDMIPEKKYRKIKDISRRIGSVADYFVFDRLNNGFFFVIDRPTDEKLKWSKVIKRKRLADVILLE